MEVIIELENNILTNNLKKGDDIDITEYVNSGILIIQKN